MTEQVLSSKTENADEKKLLSVIVPFLDEIEVLPEFHARITNVINDLQDRIYVEVIYVDDGSTDGSLALVESLDHDTFDVHSVALSRNFGKEAAMSAGLQCCNGDAVILIDADLQDPPELIPSMIDKWLEGYDVVNMQRAQRDGETWFKKKTAGSYYKLLNWLADIEIPENVGDFRLLSRRVVDELNALPEKARYMKGILAWPGFGQFTLQFDRDGRELGQTKWNYLKLFGLAVDGICSFSIKPLRIASVLGASTALAAFVFGIYIVLKTVFLGADVSGYPSLMVAILGVGGVQLLCVGLLGEYIGRIMVEVKARPNYLIKSALANKNKAKAALSDEHSE